MYRGISSLLVAAAVGATTTTMTVNPNDNDLLIASVTEQVLDRLPADDPTPSPVPVLIPAKPERVGLVATPDGMTRPVELVRPVGVADSCRQTTCGARRGDMWTSNEGPNYVALGEGQMFAEARTEEADEARDDANPTTETQNVPINTPNNQNNCFGVQQVAMAPAYGCAGAAVARPVLGVVGYKTQRLGGCWGGIQAVHAVNAYQPILGTRVRPGFFQRRAAVRQVRRGARQGLRAGACVAGT